MSEVESLIYELAEKHSLDEDKYRKIIEGFSDKNSELALNLADKLRREIYGSKIFIRGLIEISNICKNDCYYCGIRRSNEKCDRYRLDNEEITECAKEGYKLGFRTFVLQSGESNAYTIDELCSIIKRIKSECPDSAVTLSLGEKEREEYTALYEAGADRYLLRHETADEKHYKKLHPDEIHYVNRIKCLKDLKDISFQTGCGFMVGSPYQTANTLAKDLKFIEQFSPDMCGIGPFIPHKDTPFAGFKPGTLEMTCYLLSIIRLIKPNILLPATTALGTINENGREMGIKAGANVIMPNLSPQGVRKKYELYDNKLYSGEESAQNLNDLKQRIKNIGFEIVTDRGDIKEG